MKVEVIELLDSDDDAPPIKPEIPTSTNPILSRSRKEDIKMEEVSPISGGEEPGKPQIKGESSSTTMPPRFKFEIDESAKDSEGRYIVTKKVKVDRVEHLSEVPKQWPVPPEDATVAYVIDLNEDKKWQEGTSKNIAFDRFLKQEVMFYSRHLQTLLTCQTLYRTRTHGAKELMVQPHVRLQFISSISFPPAALFTNVTVLNAVNYSMRIT